MKEKERHDLEYWLDRRGFTAESSDPEKDGTVQIRVLRPKRGQPRRFPESFHLVPADEMIDSYWADRIRDLLGIPGGEKLRIVPVAGWFPRPGSEYRVRIRRGRGGLVYAFPADRRNLQDGSWRPGPTYLQGGKWTFKRGKEIPRKSPIYFAQHPETGQYVLTWGEVPIPAGAQEAVVDMAGLMLRPVRTAAYWIAGRPKVVEGLTEGQIAVYDEDLARRILLATVDYAPEFRLLGEDWTAMEIFGTPRPVKVTQAMDLLGHFADHLRAADNWRRRALLVALHPDGLPEEMLAQLSEGQQRELNRLSAQAAEQVDLAWEWYSMVFQTIENRLKAAAIAGIPASRKDIALPQPEGRKLRRRALVDLSVEEIRGLIFDLLTGKRRRPTGGEGKQAGQAAKKSKVDTSATRPSKPSKKPDPETAPTTGKVTLPTPQRPQGRLVASTGEEPTNSSVAEAMRRALAKAGEAGTTAKPKSYFFGLCSVCQTRQVRTAKPELSGKVIPGALCKKCAKNRKK